MQATGSAAASGERVLRATRAYDENRAPSGRIPLASGAVDENVVLRERSVLPGAALDGRVTAWLVP